MSKPQPELTAIAEKAGDELQIHYVSLSSLADKFLQGNSKLHSMSDLGDSIARYDFQDPMKFDSSLNGGNGGIVAGNGRLEWLLWAKDAGQAAPRGIRAKDDEWFVPVIFGVEFKDENEAIAFSISHNLSPMWGSDLTFLDQTRLFDEGLLKDQLVGLADLDMIPVGLDGNDLDLWLGLNDEPPEPLEEDDEAVNDLIDKAEDGQIESRVKLGEIWACGRHRVACGDSTDEANVRELLGDRFGVVGMVWADPPYGFGLMKEGSTGKIGNGRVYTAIANDQDTECAESAVKTCQVFDAPQIWWGANYFADSLPPSKCWLVWDKDHHGMTFADAELAWVSVDKPVRCFRHAWSGGHRASEQGQDRVHVNQKPIALCEWAFEKYGQPSDLIFDPFLGSAPSIIAAQRMEGDRTVYGFELSEAYCEVILRRYEALTGETAELVGHL